MLINSEEVNSIIKYYSNRRSQNKIKLYYEYLKDYKQKLKNYISSKLFKFKRTNKFTKNRYDNIYENRIILHTHLSDFNYKIYEYKNKKFFASEGMIKKIYLSIIAKCIEITKANRILDVGCGNGINIKILSGIFNNIEFHGIDQSTTAISKANELKMLQLDERYTEGMPHRFNFLKEDNNIFFSEQDAQYLNFPSQSFDLVYTVLALEQMSNIQMKAIDQLKRVSKKYILLIEPFENLNKNGMRYLHHASKKYFSLNPENIECNNWKIKEYNFDFPNYISLKSGYLLLEKI